MCLSSLQTPLYLAHPPPLPSSFHRAALPIPLLLTGAGGALQATPLAQVGLGFRLPLSLARHGGQGGGGGGGGGGGIGGGGGWHLAACAPVTTGAEEWVRAAERPAEGEGEWEESSASPGGAALTHSGRQGQQEACRASGGPSAAELAPPPPRPRRQRVSSGAARASPSTAGGLPPPLS